MQLTHFVRTTRVCLAPYAPTLIGVTGALIFGLLGSNAGFYDVPGIDEKTPSLLTELEFLRERPASVAALTHDTAAAKITRQVHFAEDDRSRSQPVRLLDLARRRRDQGRIDRRCDR